MLEIYKSFNRINVFVGNFGSGKTEISLNCAVLLAKKKLSVSLVDLDIINPVYRSRIARSLDLDYNIKLIAPQGELANADVPALPAAVYGVFQDKNQKAVVDVGGDDVGAVVLGRYRQYLNNPDVNIYLVINNYRPLTNDFQGVKKKLLEIEKAARIKPHYIISNPNFGQLTELEDIIEGHKIIQEFSQKLNLPIAFLAAREKLFDHVNGLNLGIPIMSLKRYMLKPEEKI